MTLAAILVADFGQRERGFLEEGGNIFWRRRENLFGGASSLLRKYKASWKIRAIVKLFRGSLISLEERKAF